MYHARKIVGLVLLLGLAAAAWFSVVLARADAEFRKGTPESVAHALDLAPRNTAYLSLRALQVDYDGGDSRPLLEEAAKLNPVASAPLIRLGLDAEVRGDLPGAERWLLDAARMDRQYEPRWTLANFYFRRQRMEDFWTWLRSALEVSYGDRAAAFDLASAAASDTRVILASAIPDRHEVVAAYLVYLLAKNSGEAAPVAIQLSQFHDPSDHPLLHQELDSLMISGHRANARQIWINLGYPDSTAPVFNPDFGPLHIGHGFDWWFHQDPGVTYTPLDAPASLRISLNGMQPESYELLKQYVDVQRGKRYLLRWESRGASSGLAWHAGAANAPLRGGYRMDAGQLVYVAARDSDFIELDYNRTLGEPRLEGSVELRHVIIEDQ